MNRCGGVSSARVASPTPRAIRVLNPRGTNHVSERPSCMSSLQRSPFGTPSGSRLNSTIRPAHSRFSGVLVCVCGIVAMLNPCPGAFAQPGHPTAWQTGVDIAGFEGDVYSALNLSGEQAQQFGRFFSSALYGLSVGDAYVQYSEGDGAGAIGTLSKATAEFAVGLSPWGAACADRRSPGRLLGTWTAS